ncbi:ATP-dependent sacrificial sulfur transferase LarE [Motilibacter aurantiacus]|uniref:ATP-dependent sacrificial sulfur transferase LarE n=1 Tax=Motilibacter aurantiacus TaxID=2714955 RepID=UPI001408AEF6|nr:ATP-dependent sacrificial sulfur transferase LarE [Motilibacter aurantiacus]NHC46713.1 ATP-dependent sacrificial sulfur transferase LarE [Motilibacter aurantiacus]
MQLTTLARAERAAADRVVDALRGQGRVGVAFSGGVDSSVLLALAAAAVGGDNVLAVLGVSPSLASRERAAAHRVAEHIGAPLLELETSEAGLEAYRRNAPDRCFHCKNELFAAIDDDVVRQHGLTAVAYGENADDARRPDRPGARAAAAHRVLRPLADAGMGKSTVRAIARALALPCADKPAAPCLASRIPHFSEVTPEKLRQVEDAEAGLAELGFAELRVRHHGAVARVELLPEDLSRAAAEPMRTQIVRTVRAAGFDFVAVDLAGIQSGAFTLPLVEARHG